MVVVAVCIHLLAMLVVMAGQAEVAVLMELHRLGVQALQGRAMRVVVVLAPNPEMLVYVAVGVENLPLEQMVVTASHNPAMAALATNGLIVCTTPQVVVVETGQPASTRVMAALVVAVAVDFKTAVELLVLVAVLQETQEPMAIQVTVTPVTLAAVPLERTQVLEVVALDKVNFQAIQELVAVAALELS